MRSFSVSTTKIVPFDGDADVAGTEELVHRPGPGPPTRQIWLPAGVVLGDLVVAGVGDHDGAVGRDLETRGVELGVQRTAELGDRGGRVDDAGGQARSRPGSRPAA